MIEWNSKSSQVPKIQVTIGNVNQVQIQYAWVSVFSINWTLFFNNSYIFSAIFNIWHSTDFSFLGTDFPSGITLCMHPANERWRYIVTSSPIGWAHTQNDPWTYVNTSHAGWHKYMAELLIPDADNGLVSICTTLWSYTRADSRIAPSQWETSLQSNAISHWLGANLESALYTIINKWHRSVLNGKS